MQDTVDIANLKELLTEKTWLFMQYRHNTIEAHALCNNYNKYIISVITIKTKRLKILKICDSYEEGFKAFYTIFQQAKDQGHEPWITMSNFD